MEHETETTIEQLNGILRDPVFSLSWEEISAWAAVHRLCYGQVRLCTILSLLPPVMEASFVLVALTRMIVSEFKH